LGRGVEKGTTEIFEGLVASEQEGKSFKRREKVKFLLNTERRRERVKSWPRKKVPGAGEKHVGGWRGARGV